MNLYHYCSTNTFFSVMQDKEVWLSSLPLSNDTMEGKWVTSVFDAMRADVSKSVTSNIDELLRRVFGLLRVYAWSINGLGICFSEAGDILSQWRA